MRAELKLRKLLSVVVLVIVGIGSFWLGSRTVMAAKPAHPIAVAGTLASYGRLGQSSWFDFIRGDTYQVEVDSSDSGRAGPYQLHPREFHPAPGDLSQRVGDDVTAWYDQDTDDLIALQIGGSRPAMDYFSHPGTKYWDAVTIGLLLGSPAFLILVGLLMWGLRRTRQGSIYTEGSAEAGPARPMFEWPYPREPIALPRPASAILLDFKAALVTSGDIKARPERLLHDRREEIIVALFEDVKKKDGMLADSDLRDLKQSLDDLQTFVPNTDAELVARYVAKDAGPQVGDSSLPREDRERAVATLDRIGAGQRGVANFRHDEPGILIQGVNFMVEETLKWSRPAEAKKALENGQAEAYGCLVYLGSGLTAIVLLIIGAIRFGSMQFWATIVAVLTLIGLAIWAAPVIDRAGTWADDLGGLAAKAGTGLLFVLLLVGPVAICIALVSLLTALVS
jgi:hypothetical protein